MSETQAQVSWTGCTSHHMGGSIHTAWMQTWVFVGTVSLWRQCKAAIRGTAVFYCQHWWLKQHASSFSLVHWSALTLSAFYRLTCHTSVFNVRNVSAYTETTKKLSSLHVFHLQVLPLLLHCRLSLSHECSHSSIEWMIYTRFAEICSKTKMVTVSW